MRRPPRRSLWAFAIAAWALPGVLAPAVSAQPPPPVRYVTYEEARTVLPASAALPAVLVTGDEASRKSAFDSWVKTQDLEVRARVLRGEEDSLVPLLLFGTSFTQAPRLTRAFVEQLAREAARQGDAAAERERAFALVFERRTDDLLRALRAPGANQRVAWARATMERLGHRFDTPAGLAAAGRSLVETFARVTRESEAAASQLAAQGSAPGPAALALRAHLFAERGLAPDTGWPINFALSAALGSLKALGAFGGVSPIRRLAVVGPGLDFVDKDEGLDYYPPQTLQPFAMIDALARAGLASADEVDVLTLDLSPRVNDHLRRAQSGTQPYVLQLVATNGPWTDAAIGYWSTFGSAIGEEVTPLAPPAGAAVRSARAIRLRRDVPRRLTVVDANIVHQRVDLPDRSRLDLVVATNMLLYYGAAEQALAVANIMHMLRPGGVILTNTRLTESANTGVAKVAEVLAVFSSRPGDGEVVYAYTRPYR